MPKVVTCLLENKGKILILKRSEKVGTYKGMWGGVAGYVEKGETPVETAQKEIKEEVGLEKTDIKYIKKSEPIKFSDTYKDRKYDWEVYPFLYYVIKKDKIKIDWEHSELKWISPKEIYNYNTVPHLKDIFKNFFG